MYACPHCQKLTISIFQIIGSGTSAKLECNNCKSVLKINGGLKGIFCLAPLFIAFWVIHLNSDAGIVNYFLWLAIGIGFSWALATRWLSFLIVKMGDI